MADLNVINGGEMFINISDIRPGLAGAGGLAFMQSVYLDPTTGTYLPTSAGASGTAGFNAIMVGPYAGAGKGQAVDLLEMGYVSGYDVSALAFGAPVYLSNTAGKLSSTPGTANVVVGYVAALTDKDPITGLPSKFLKVRPNPF